LDGKSEGAIIKFDDIEFLPPERKHIWATFIAIAGEKDKFTGKYV